MEVDYVNDFSNNGDGFHRFVDPVDGEVYVYSNFEPYCAHHLFPCFDQVCAWAGVCMRVCVCACV